MPVQKKAFCTGMRIGIFMVQKRDEFEATEEICLEQNSNTPIVDHHVFLQMVDDVEGTHYFMAPSMFLYPKVKENRTRSIEYAFYS